MTDLEGVVRGKQDRGIRLVAVLVSVVVFGCAAPLATVTLVNPNTDEGVTCPEGLSRALPVTGEQAGQQRSWHADFQRIHKRLPSPLEGCLKTYEILGYVHQPYTNPVYAWSVSYPAGWNLDNADAQFVKIQPPRESTFALVGIVSISTTTPQTVEAFTETMLVSWERHLSAGLKVVLVSRRTVRLANDVPAVEVIHELGTGQTGKSRKIFAVVPGRAVLIDAETHSQSWSTLEVHFDAIIKSLVFQ